MVSYRHEVSLSEDQRAVLIDTSSRALVSAGAGSGKTRLLVAYFVHALLDLDIPMEDLAAVTFTRKAGSELADRIRKELVSCARPDLAREVDNAAIGTMHGLCRRLLAGEALGAGVDPSFGILEEDTGRLVRERVSKDAWSRVIEEATEEELRLLAPRHDGLRTLMLSLYERLRGMGRLVPQVEIVSGPADTGARGALAAACDEALRQGRSAPKMGPDLHKSLERISACRSWLDDAAADPDGEVTVADTEDFFPSLRTTSARPYLEPMRDALIRYRQALAERELARLVAVTNKLLGVFHERYEAYKQSRGVVDFADLELRTKLLLSGRSGAATAGGPPGYPDPATRVPSGRHGAVVATPSRSNGLAARGLVFASHILVDEFQDTNELQCAILDGLGSDHMLMVGDARQSIYGFRGANVEVFLAREQSPDIGQHRLDTNYRSRPELLAFINHLFSRPTFFDTRHQPLLAGRDAGPSAEGCTDEPQSNGLAGPTEILVAERTSLDGEKDELAKQEAEAYVVADRVRRLVDAEGWRQTDIAVLLPQLTEVNRYQEALLSRGLDVYVVRGKGYYSQDEVEDVSALLRLLLNPHDDLALLTVLRSPLVGVSDDCLYLLGSAVRTLRASSLWEAVRKGLAAGEVDEEDTLRLTTLVSRLNDLQAQVGRPGLSRLIEEAVSACDYDLCLLAAPHGKRRFANVRKLMRIAADYEELEGPDLQGFVTLIGSLGDMGDDEGNAPSLAEGEDVVRVMTVHQAKGLEFPVVVLAGLCSDPRRYQVPEILVGDDGRMAALIRVDKDHDQPCWGPAAGIVEDQRRRKAEEDIRLLYVAMTRARDRLILVGSRKSDDKPDSARIGRIVTALGLDSPPAPGTSVSLEDIHAVVSGVTPPRPDNDGASRSVALPAAGDGLAEAPCLLNLPATGADVRHFSFSALAACDRCPRRFYLERVLGLGPVLVSSPVGCGAGGDPEENGAQTDEETRLDNAERSSGVEVGILVHELLAGLDLTGARPQDDHLLSRAEATAVSKGLPVSVGALSRAASLVSAFWEHPLAGTARLEGALREAPFFFVHQGASIDGVMDVLIRGEDCWTVLDYKSNALGERTPAEAARTYSLQAAIYCLAALKAGAPAVRMEFVFLERPADPTVLEYTQEDQPALELLLEEALAGVRSGDYPARSGVACADCHVKNVCEAMSRS